MRPQVDGTGLGNIVAFGAKVGAPTAVSVGVAAGPQPDLLIGVTNGLEGTLAITYAPLTDSSVYTPGASTSGTDGDAAGLTSFATPPPFAYNSVAANYPIKDVVGRSGLRRRPGGGEHTNRQYTYSSRYSMPTPRWTRAVAALARLREEDQALRGRRPQDHRALQPSLAGSPRP